MGRYGNMPNEPEGFAYNKIANIESLQSSKERLLNERSVNSGFQHVQPYIKPQDNESLENYIRRTAPYIEMLMDRSIQEHINGSKMFWCHKNTKQACFMCDQINVMNLQWETLNQVFQALPNKVKLTYTNNKFQQI